MPSEYPPDQARRVVKPRKPSAEFRHVMAIAEEVVIVERTGQTYLAQELPQLIASEPSSIIACQGFGRHLQRITRIHGDDPRYNYRVTPKYREYRGTKTRVTDAVVNFVGFKSDEQRKNARYHYPLDPVHFVRTSIEELRPCTCDERPCQCLGRVVKLLEWAKEVRDWCIAERLTIKTSSGGLVAQLLRDPRFYPQPRRKVPRMVNDTARDQLPGNYYRLHTDTERTHRAVYLDMSSAHHVMAARIRFPDANTLQAYGYWRRWETARPYANGQSDMLKRPGLFRLRLHIPNIPASKFPPPYAEIPGTRDAWVYSNEFEMLSELSIRIDGVICALTAHEAEAGMNAYAKWALDQIRAYPTLKPWLKPTLHSTYGVLAARPMPFETAYYRASGGTSVEYPMGSVSVPATARKTDREIESNLANVIHRGMIEAEVRKEALWMARFLTEADRRQVLAIYADSVFVRNDGQPMRMLPPWWRISDYLDDLRFFDATHFTSEKLIRLPGVSRRRSDDERQRLLQHARLGRFDASESDKMNGTTTNRQRRRSHAATAEEDRREPGDPGDR